MAVLKTMADAINLAKHAFESDEVEAFLSGEGEYAVTMSRYASANVPTDFGYILRVCLYGYFNEGSNSDIPEKYKNALKQLLSGNDKSVWIAFSVCFYQVANEVTKIAPFSIMDDEFLAFVSYSINQKRTDLELCRIWMGERKEKGLWQDIEESNSVLAREYGVSLI